MKKWLIGFVLVVLLAAVVVLVKYDIISWQMITVIAAAVAAPFKFIFGLFSDKEEEIRERHAAARQRELEYQRTLEGSLEFREQRVSELRGEVEIIDEQIKLLEKKRDQLKGDSGNISKQQQRGRDLFGS